jgi:uncharacterized membrane protein YuzA (DUF378 family)
VQESNFSPVLHDKTIFLYPQIMKVLDTIATALVIVGAINWGLVGLFHIDLVAAVFGMSFGDVSIASAAVSTLVGLAGLYRALMLGAGRRHEMSPAKV